MNLKWWQVLILIILFPIGIFVLLMTIVSDVSNKA